MATIKTDRLDFEKLLNGLDPVTSANEISNAQSEAVVPSSTPVNNVVDNTSAAETMNAPRFNIDFEGTKKGLRKKARKTILGIVKHIIPEDIINEEYVNDKIEQDIEILTALYMQLENNTIMQRSIIESINSGNITPRMYEVFGQLTDKIQSINKQIFDTEQRIRKTYVDLKYEIRDKQGEDLALGIGTTTMKIENQKQGNVITSTKNLISAARKKHIDKINNIKEAEYEIEE